MTVAGLHTSFQSALYALLKSSTPLASFVGARVFDDVPKDQIYPYVVMGDDTWADGGDKTDSGFETTVTLHYWSQYNGRKQIHQMMDVVYNLLHRNRFALTVGQVVSCLFDYSNVMLESDGRTRHGVQRFRFILSSANP